MSNHYTYRAEWSAEDDEYVGLVAEFPSLSWLAPTAAEAVAGAAELVDGILADMDKSGETPPKPLTERRYSGNLSFRTSPAQHRKLAIEAAEQGVSVNQLLIYKLASKTAVAPAAVADMSSVIAEASRACTALPVIAGIQSKVIEQARAAIPDSVTASTVDYLIENPAMKELMAANVTAWVQSVSEKLREAGKEEEVATLLIIPTGKSVHTG
ncbi:MULTISPECIES: type II toxin-antitoxin system HicB family antitoxin [Mycobacteriaceae]|uniref:HicB n=1 Tax=Mycolicibacterium neoaurum VKM Ac-1815D TaxID=700508 RepID=V5XDV3_MYCNE|nr:toxin-antitoxin system HicB family antitoxin [Mycolicibacterium neoaurum]AXK74703.1 toxin-antitoxin system HicB family antitoxin [Mycolicibacterium neoaurum]